MRFGDRRLLLGFLLGAAASSLAGAGAALAEHGGGKGGNAGVPVPASGPLRACIKHGNGTLYVIGAARCKHGDAEIALNVAGVPGAPGAKGDPGPPGPRAARTARAKRAGREDGASGAAALVSPNKKFRIQIGDNGIYLRGPGGTVFVDRHETGTGDRFRGR